MGDEIYAHWENDDRVAIIHFLDDISQPYSCSDWGDYGTIGIPPIVDDGTPYTVLNWFENPSSAGLGSLVVFIDHTMTVAKIMSSAPLFNEANAIIDNLVNEIPNTPDCLDETACNYNPNAMVDDGTCIYPEENYDCEGICIAVIDCSGECGGSSVEDECGICSGDNSSCKDCNGVINGDAFIDGCESCVGGNTGEEGCAIDCAGEENGEALFDNCGSCDNDQTNDCILDCLGEWGGETIDDCAGICGGPAVEDECGICNDPVCNVLGTPSPFSVGNNPCQSHGEYPISTLWNSTCDPSLSLNYISLPNYLKINNLYPNPFNPVLNIDFDINQAGWVKVHIADIKGSLVKTVYEGYEGVGKHQIRWNSETLPSGTYFVTLESDYSSLTKKVVLLK
ncbi:MAG: T9SS type A sorting domain-containing protein [Candidatus Marinimicrobia bacterium]|nr:T9SS type A sorting domain-containing protein [Candidatus Neomarinimicrobiota bacterium]